MALSVSPIDVVDLTPTAPDVAILTTQDIDGTGVFDVLMKSVKAHLVEEYENQRITGKEYSTVYLGALSSVMQQSVAYILNAQQTAKINAELGLVRQKIVTELVQTDNDIPIGLGFNGDGQVEGLVASQKDLITSQIEAVDADVALNEQKTVTELTQTSDSIPAGLGHNTNAVPEGLVRANIDKTGNEADLIEQKSVTELAQTSEAIPVDLGFNTFQTIEGLVALQKDLTQSQIEKTDKEILKADSEIGLLDQKTATELAQTSDTIPSGFALNVSTAVEGVLAKQKDLYVKQKDGFDRDAEQKLTKIMVDTWIVRQTTDGADSGLAGLAEADVKAVLDIAKAGI